MAFRTARSTQSPSRSSGGSLSTAPAAAPSRDFFCAKTRLHQIILMVIPSLSWQTVGSHKKLARLKTAQQ
eukprot:COSAG06_NODE_148_length_22056_cov_75.881239_2_plen_70_part_00